MPAGIVVLPQLLPCPCRCCSCTNYNEESICLGHPNHQKSEVQTSYFVAPGIQAVFEGTPERHRKEVARLIKHKKTKSLAMKELQRQLFSNDVYNHSDFIAFTRFDARGYSQVVWARQAKSHIEQTNNQKLADLAHEIPQAMWSYLTYKGQLLNIADNAAAGVSRQVYNAAAGFSNVAAGAGNVVARVGRQTDGTIRSPCSSIRSGLWRQLPKLTTPQALEEYNERILDRESSHLNGHAASVKGLPPMVKYPYLAVRATVTSLRANISLIPQSATSLADPAETSGGKKRRSSTS